MSMVVCDISICADGYDAGERLFDRVPPLVSRVSYRVVG